VCSVAHAEPSATSDDVAPPPPNCLHSDLQPGATLVPANLPAFVIDDRERDPAWASTLEITAVRGGKLALDRRPDPRDAQSTLLVPARPDLLEVGVTYEIDYTVKCSYAPNPGNVTTSFTVTSSVPLPTRIGDAKLYADGAVFIATAPEQQAFLATTRFEALVDGAIYMGSGYVGGSNEHGYGGALCTTRTLETERHDIELRAHVAGADSDPAPIKLSVDVDCSEVVADSRPPLSFASPSTGPSAAVVHTGCAIPGARPPGFFGAGAGTGLLAGLALLARRRGNRDSAPLKDLDGGRRAGAVPPVGTIDDAARRGKKS